MSIRRVTVLHESGGASGAFELEAEIAASLEAELVGLFVEDLKLVKFAALPFAREIGASIAITRRVDPQSMARALRAKAEQARRALQAAALRRPVRWSFSVVRGLVADQVCAAVAEADLVIFPSQAAPRDGARRLAVLSTAAQDALVAPSRSHLTDVLASEFDLLLLGAGPDVLERWLRATRAPHAGPMTRPARVRAVGGPEDLAGLLAELRTAAADPLSQVNPSIRRPA